MNTATSTINGGTSITNHHQADSIVLSVTGSDGANGGLNTSNNNSNSADLTNVWDFLNHHDHNQHHHHHQPQQQQHQHQSYNNHNHHHNHNHNHHHDLLIDSLHLTTDETNLILSTGDGQHDPLAHQQIQAHDFHELINGSGGEQLILTQGNLHAKSVQLADAGALNAAATNGINVSELLTTSPTASSSSSSNPATNMIIIPNNYLTKVTAGAASTTSNLLTPSPSSCSSSSSPVQTSNGTFVQPTTAKIEQQPQQV